MSVGKWCDVAGWGQVRFMGQKPDVLMEVSVPINDWRICAENYMRSNSTALVTEDTICAGRSGKDSCYVSYIFYST